MIKLKELAKNPAYTLAAMLYGLQNPVSTKDVKYEVDMKTFGAVSSCGTVCYGCAATCALQVITGLSIAEHITHMKLNNAVSRAFIFNADYKEMRRFEQCVDAVRSGSFATLMSFFGYDGHRYDQTGITMITNGWQEEVPVFEQIIERMHKDYPKWERFKEPGEQND